MYRFVSLLLIFGYAYALIAAANFNITTVLLLKIEQQFGQAARTRVLQWQQLMQTGQALSDVQKLNRVNDFFNQAVRFESDSLLWQVADYWATPLEFLSKGAGDCEDYAIAKYFTLKALGVPEAKMRITYVKAIQQNQAHMVLTYFEGQHTVPLVLDNLQPSILPATARQDLVPVYSFNDAGLWLAQVRGMGQAVGGAERLSRWTDLIQRMQQSGF